MKKIVKTFAVSMTLIAALLVAVSVQAKDARLTGMTGTVEVLKDAGFDVVRSIFFRKTQGSR